MPVNNHHHPERAAEARIQGSAATWLGSPLAWFEGCSLWRGLKADIADAFIQRQFGA